MSFAQLKLKSCFLISKAIILRGFNDASLISRMYNPKLNWWNLNMMVSKFRLSMDSFGLICRFQPNDVGEGRLKCQHFVLPGHFIMCYLIFHWKNVWTYCPQGNQPEYLRLFIKRTGICRSFCSWSCQRRGASWIIMALWLISLGHWCHWMKILAS